MSISYSSEKSIVNGKGIQREMFCSRDQNQSPICKEKVTILDAPTNSCSLMELLKKNHPLSLSQSRKKSDKKSTPKKTNKKTKKTKKTNKKTSKKTNKKK